MEAHYINLSDAQFDTLLAAIESITSDESETIAYTAAELEAALDYVYRQLDYNSEPIGVQYDTTSDSPTLERIDVNGSALNVDTSYFNNHVIWGGMMRWARDRTTGVFKHGTNPRGDGLALDSTDGDIFTSVPTGNVWFNVDGDFNQYYALPFYKTDSRFRTHPLAYQRGGTAKPLMYVGSFEAGLRNFSTIPVLQSISGVEPVTGGSFRYVAFTSGGTTAITTGSTITGSVSGVTATVISISVTSGSWSGGDAAGTLWVKLQNGSFNSSGENLLVSGVDCATIAANSTPISLTLADAEGYGNNLGSGMGICNVHTYSWLKLLMGIEYGTFNIQYALAKGVVDLDNSTTAFLGNNTGASSTYANMAANGTGDGSGSIGYRSFTWRTIENFYGNIYEWMAGLNMYLSDGSARLLPAKGTTATTIPATLTSYESVSGIPTSVDGYILSLLADQASDYRGAIAFLPATSGSGTNSINMCDNFAYPKYSPSVGAHGGFWYSGYGAGPFCLSGSMSPSTSAINIGCRLEYIPQ